MRHGYWDTRQKEALNTREEKNGGTLCDGSDVTAQAAEHLLLTRIKRFRMAMTFIRDHAADQCTRLYAEGAIECDDTLS